ncbi:MAG: hypothetical protein ACXV74_13415 [Methylobacter sp.]
MKNMHFLFWLILGMISLPISASAAATSNTTSTSIDITRNVFVPPPCGGVTGEIVELVGSLHILTITTINGNHSNIQVKFQPQGVSGVGEITGNTYQGTGATQRTIISDNDSFPLERIEVNNFNIIGHGSDPNAMEHDLVHITINANGETTASIDSSSIICQTSG